MRAIIIATLLASLSAWAAAPFVIDELRIASDCEERRVKWEQPWPRPDWWEVEWRRIVPGNPITYERPLSFVTFEPEWRGKVPAGLYQIRVRGRYEEDGEEKFTEWAESTLRESVRDAREFLMSVHVCPPTDFEPI